MLRDLLWGGLFFAAGYAVAKNLDGVKKDLAHYDKLREMSGEPPLIGEQLQRISGLAGAATSMLGGKNTVAVILPFLGMIPGLRSDVERYSRLKAM